MNAGIIKVPIEELEFAVGEISCAECYDTVTVGQPIIDRRVEGPKILGPIPIGAVEKDKSAGLVDVSSVE